MVVETELVGPTRGVDLWWLQAGMETNQAGSEKIKKEGSDTGRWRYTWRIV